MKRFIKHHILTILKSHEDSPSPMDSFLRRYFREHHAIGSHDRKNICETLYTMIKQKGLIDFFCPKPFSWENRLATTLKLNSIPSDLIRQTPPHVQVSFPKFLYDKLTQALDVNVGHEFCYISNGIAPVTVRINPDKTSRQQFLETYKEDGVMPTKMSKLGVIFPKKMNFFSWDTFKEGHFEIQDEGSQLIAELMDVKKGDHVLDYCAGAGGKTLAFAHKMEGKGQIYLHDIREYALDSAKLRLKRAGVQNIQLTSTKTLKKKRFEKKMDWILLDVPCSGSGTLRRNPEIKWKLCQNDIDNLIQSQRLIFGNALHFLHPNGKIVYATCSVFKEENDEQIAFFEKTHGLKLLQEPFRSLPTHGGMDGFFCAVLGR
ncbi:SAM-dependent methyltransferase [Candidatus Aerophobetes bacterium]|uniref:SAM-dependent methyltransferase n=1 Tax=Aerophobetes bacterium TaxID=2030807 RepID=A0A2A4X792_UNCAE|nr:MAG: SAM-dependent methyltransferase [Candidatus Aerophobetes bacterium]